HLHLPSDSGLGAKLDATSSEPYAGPVALGVMTGAAGDTIAIASARGIDLIRPDGRRTTIAVPATAGLDRLLPITGTTDRVQFLVHGSAGWSLLTTAPDARTAVRPTALRGVPATANLAVPVESEHRAYTIDRSNGQVLKLADDGTATPVVTYQVVQGIETPDFSDAYLLGRGPRVIVDSPNHIYAITLFTDRRGDAPQLIDKNAAVDVNASGGAEAIARAHAAAPAPKPGQSAPTPVPQPSAPPPAPVPVQPIDNALACKDTTQTPHQPAFTLEDAGSRSLHLEWHYPKLDAQDCVPSTYVVSVELVSPGAPKPQQGTVTVQGQTGVTIGGLFPNTQYSVTLTAVLNTRGTSTQPILVTTGPEGPAAPTGVTAQPTASGAWTVSWKSCGTVAQGCVPASSWDIVPAYCDGKGLSAPPATITVIGDPTLSSFSATYAGGGALLGRSLQFRVLGHGADGTVGTPSGLSGCAQSWAPPNPAGVTFSAAQPPSATLGGTVSAKLTVNLGSTPQAAVGGLGGGVRFQLTGPDGVVTRGPVVYDGSSAILSATFDGIRPGAAYTATAFLVPPGHPEAAVQLATQPVSTSASWPAALAFHASCPPDNGLVRLSCQLTITFSGLASSDAHGETFDLTGDSRLQCGNRAQPISGSGLDPASAQLTSSVSLLQYNGACTVHLGLVESPGTPNPKLFGGIPTTLPDQDIALGQPETLDAQGSDFAVTWTSTSDVQVQYTGSHRDDEVAALTQDWQETLLAPDGTTCGSGTRQPTHDGITVQTQQSCIDTQGQTPGWKVQLSYADTGTSNTHTYTETLVGTPPTYRPCNIANGNPPFTATWDGTAAAPVAHLQFTGADADVAGCSGWTYSVQTPQPDTADCGDGPQNTSPSAESPDIRINLTCQTAPSDGWSVHITFQRPNGHTDSVDVDITGPVPQ
ncbi:MAG: hypothetical protein ACTHMS_00140, partial [Jatrophihabitans sp.]|uniref:fibronectin type III domain-containing protein n=1 Tax=Jatrophihabitans sp. TaxID=1932789 RepID=UPI003F80412E